MANNWTREQTLVAFRLYCQTAYGKLNQSNPDIPPLAAAVGRTPSAVIMKACNFAGLDPLHQARGVTGLSNRSKLESEIWAEFEADSEAVADEAERAFEALSQAESKPFAVDAAPVGPTEVLSLIHI